MKQTIKFAALLIIAIAMAACSQKEQPASTASHPKAGKYSFEYVKKISLTQPKRALKILDDAEKKQLMSKLDILTLKSIVYNNAMQDYKSAAKYAKEALNTPNIEKSPERQLKLYNMAAAQLYNCGNYIESLKNAEKGIELAYKHDNRKAVAQLLMTIGECHGEVGNQWHAINALNRCIEILTDEVKKKGDWDNYYDLLTAYSQKADLLVDMKDYKTLLKTEEEYKTNLDILNTLPEEVSGANDISNAAYYSLYAITYQRSGNHPKAREYFDKLLTTRTALTPEGATFVVPYLMETNRYPEAMKKICEEEETWMKNGRDTIDFNYSHNILMNKARILQSVGKYKEAIETGMRAYYLSDSLSRRIKAQNATWMSEEMGKKVLNKYIERQGKQLTVNRAANIVMGVLLFICIILIAFVIRDNRLIKKKNRISSSLISELSIYKRELFNRMAGNGDIAEPTTPADAKTALPDSQRPIYNKVENTPHDAATATNNVASQPTGETNGQPTDGNKEQDTEYEQFLQIEKVIFDKNLFMHHKLSREEVAEAADISITAFNILFARFSKVPFNNYINELRMERAAKLLKEKPNYSIEAIAQECGVPVRQTFYRLFAKKFGMTPAEYRSNVM